MTKYNIFNPNNGRENIVKHDNSKYVSKVIQERTSSSSFHERCASTYTSFINNDDEKQMHEIEIEQKTITSAYYTPTKKSINKNGIAVKVDNIDNINDIEDEDTTTTPRTVKARQKKKPLNKAFQVMDEFKRPQAADRNHPLYEQHMTWKKEQATHQWLTERRLEDRTELYLLKLKLDKKVHKDTEKLSNKLNSQEEKKRKAFLAEQEFKLKVKLEKEHFEMMKKMKKEAYKKARNLFCYASLKQNFRSWAKYTQFMKEFRAKRQKKRKRQCKICILGFIILIGALYGAWFLYTEIARMQATKVTESERRRLNQLNTIPKLPLRGRP
jgi:hypothetical protein